MLFHAFRVVYTVKELDSHAKHGQSFKKRFGSMTEYFCAKKSYFRVRTSFGGCIRNRPLYPQIVHYLRGQPF